MAGQHFSGFTQTYNARAKDIISEGHVSPSEKYLKELTKLPSNTIKVKALWDTGATNSAITSSLAKKLKLLPIGKAQVEYGGSTAITNVYLVNIFLPNKFIIPFNQVTECKDSTKFDLIIGMDIINRGDFSITNVGAKTVFSFRMPSIKNIDYVKEATAIRTGKAAAPHASKKKIERDQYLKGGKKGK